MFSSYYPGWYAVFQASLISLVYVKLENGYVTSPWEALILAGIAFALWLAAFILQGVGLHTMAKRAGLPKPWLAFVPFAHVMLVGKLAGDVSFFGHRIRRLGFYTMLLEIVAAIFYVFVSVAMYVLFVQNGEAMEIRIIDHVTHIGWSTLPAAAQGWQKFYEISNYVVDLLSLVHAIVLLLLYMGFYKRYAYRNHFLLSIAGIFIPFFHHVAVFVIRKRDRIDYEAIMRARQEAFRAQQQQRQNNPWQGGYGGTYGNPYGNPYGSQSSNSSPSGESPQEKKPEDPFGEFSDGSASKDGGQNGDGFFN
jgi:hypothetical protein